MKHKIIIIIIIMYVGGWYKGVRTGWKCPTLREYLFFVLRFVPFRLCDKDPLPRAFIGENRSTQGQLAIKIKQPAKRGIQRILEAGDE